jgi:hypothetical protein
VLWLASLGGVGQHGFEEGDLIASAVRNVTGMQPAAPACQWLRWLGLQHRAACGGSRCSYMSVASSLLLAWQLCWLMQGGDDCYVLLTPPDSAGMHCKYCSTHAEAWHWGGGAWPCALATG